MAGWTPTTRHGWRSSFRPPQTAGNNAGPVLNQEAIAASLIAPLDLYFSACLGGQTVEGLSGTPSGLISACFQRNARWVVGALIAIPDQWALMLALLTHQAMVQEHRPLPLPAALQEGKRRLASGDWYPDTAELLLALGPVPSQRGVAIQIQQIWESLSVEHFIRAQRWALGGSVHPRDFYNDLRAAFARNAIAWILQTWDFDASEIDVLHRQLHHHGPETLAMPLGAALAVHWPSRPRIPPEPALGTLIHGLVVFGEAPHRGAS